MSCRHNLTVGGTQTVTFNGAVGGAKALGALSVSGPTDLNTTTVATSNAGGGSGNQTYTGAVTLGTANGTTVDAGRPSQDLLQRRPDAHLDPRPARQVRVGGGHAPVEAPGRGLGSPRQG